MKINNIAFVGIPVTDVRRARQFYGEVLGLAVSDEMFDIEKTETPVCWMAQFLKVERVVPNALARPDASAWGQADPPFSFPDFLVHMCVLVDKNTLRNQGVPFAAEPLKRRAVTWRWYKIQMETNS
jgi:catechol 2,3-dioxygenase-like lactoylglutathione lyase family enzyme